jgi:hypothetical protein
LRIIFYVFRGTFPGIDDWDYADCLNFYNIRYDSRYLSELQQRMMLRLTKARYKAPVK